MLSEEEIERLCREAHDEVKPYGCDLDCEFSWTEVLVFAHKIEAKVRSEYEPKFKVGDRVEIDCHLGERGGTIEVVYNGLGSHSYCVNVGNSTFPVDLYVGEENIIRIKK